MCTVKTTSKTFGNLRTVKKDFKFKNTFLTHENLTVSEVSEDKEVLFGVMINSVCLSYNFVNFID